MTYNFKDFDLVCFESVFGWPGHAARMALYDAKRLTHKTLLLKCGDSIQEVARWNNGDQLHGHTLRVWRWEHMLYSFFRQTSWMHVERRTSTWTEMCAKFLATKSKSC